VKVLRITIKYTHLTAKGIKKFLVKVLRITIQYTHFTAKEIRKFLEEPNVEPVEEKLRRYSSEWLRFANRRNS